MSEYAEVKSRVERLHGKLELLQTQKKHTKTSVELLQLKLVDVEEAQMLLQHVAQQTQAELEYHVSELVSLALESVFPDPYEMCVEFVLRRNKTEADLLFKRDDEYVEPLEASGGGTADVAAFALRVSLMGLEEQQRDAVLVLDEPFRFVSRNLQALASKMLADLSKRIGMQMIIVSHEETLIEHADRVFAVTQKNGISKTTRKGG